MVSEPVTEAEVLARSAVEWDLRADADGQVHAECWDGEGLQYQHYGVAEVKALATEVLAARARIVELEMVRDVALLMRQDIRDWTRTARGLRARSADPDFDPACPHQRGIDESERILEMANSALKRTDTVEAR